MKRFVSFLVVATLIVGFQPAIGQSFGPKMKVFSDSSSEHTFVIPKHNQFKTGDCDALVRKTIQNNAEAIIQQMNNSGALIIYGTQDEQGSNQKGLGECRAREAANVISDKIWGRNDQLEKLTQVRTQELVMSNDLKRGAKTYKEKLLVQRDVVFVFTNKDGTVDQRFEGIEAEVNGIRQRLSSLEESVWWLWRLLALTALVAIAAAALHLYRSSDDQSDGNESSVDNDGGDDPSLRRRTREYYNDEENLDLRVTDIYGDPNDDG